MVSYTTNLSELSEFVPKFAKGLKGGEMVGLVGDLGAGKTTFTQMLSKELGITDRVTSPTFVIMQSFSGQLLMNQKPVKLYHLDVYRLDDFKDLEGLGLSDFMGKENTVTVVEWADKFEDFWPEGMIWVRLEV